jgi:hypothetical protein
MRISVTLKPTRLEILRQGHPLRSRKHHPGSNRNSLFSRDCVDQHSQFDRPLFRQINLFGRCSHLSSPEMKFIKFFS